MFDSERIILRDIFYNLKEKSEIEPNIGVLDGLSGIMIFDYYYSVYVNEKENDSNIEHYLDLIINKINSQNIVLSFCSGLTGFMWSIDFLTNRFDVQLINDSIIEDIENILYNQMIKDFESNKFDFLHGALGNALYFLKRYVNEQNKLKKIKYSEYLIDTFEFLKRISIEEGHETKWSLPKDKYNKHNIYNFGLAHGIPSIIYFLSKLLKYKIRENEVRLLLQKGINYIMNNTITKRNAISFFPTGIIDIKEYDINDDESRLAWCYGDLGVSFTLLKAAEILKDETLKKKVIDMLVKSSERTKLIENKVFDAPFCHGIFGIAYLYFKIYRLTNIDVFLKQFNYWYNVGIDTYYNNDKKIMNFATVNMGDKTTKLKYGILEGISGIGMVLLAKNYRIDLSWDECLMLS